MQAAAGPTYYTDAGKFVQPMSTAPYMMPPCVGQQGGVTWVQQYVNGSPMLVPVYTVTPSQPMQYYQQPVYFNTQYRDNNAENHYQQGVCGHQMPLAGPESQINSTRTGVIHKVTPSKRSSVSSDVSGSGFLPSNDQRIKTTSQLSNARQIYATPKREILRYESADSGIADSPPSVASVVWSGDESLEDSDSVDSKNGRISENGSESGTKDNDEDCWTVQDDVRYWARLGQTGPNRYQSSAIAKQVEYYLSDDYLVKDKYLLRQIRCKKDGYVSIKLITSFKKVKKLTRDWQVVRSAIARNSSDIVVSPEGLRIRRRTKLSDNLRKPRLLTSVLVIRLPDDYNSVEKVTSLFRNFGEISFVRLLRANKEVPADLRNYATQVHDIGTTQHEAMFFCGFRPC
uniref:La-related protein 6 n=1 Tax=Phallusia mammillata TaxID=59560 RepID=A0A6F9DK30_9ASCI|nr:la-related protein 6 [Phallusia mammillata]